MRALALIFLLACAGPDRLEPPPQATTCTISGAPCEWDGQCCTGFCATWNACEDPRLLVPPDAAIDSCTPEQVDVALMIDLSGSMSNWLDDVQRLLSDALPRIPSTTAIQVWVIPPDGADGTYARVTGLVTPREALAVVQDLMTNSSGREASLDVTDALIRSRSDWRYGTTVRAFVMISDEMPQSYVTSPPLTVAQVCALAEPNDRLVVYTLNSERVYWDASCWDVRSLWELDSLPDLVVDPCMEVM